MYSIPHLADSVTPGYDIAAAPGTPANGAKSKRKQTLLSLLDALHELSRDGDLELSGTCHIMKRSVLPNISLLPIRQQSAAQLRR
jgi:hypothetical protein